MCVRAGHIDGPVFTYVVTALFVIGDSEVVCSPQTVWAFQM